MKRLIFDIIRIVVLLIAFSVLLYPTISNYLYEKNSSRVVSSYDEEVVRLNRQEKEELLAQARAYNQEMLKNIELLDPFSLKTKEVNERYESILRINDAGMMGYLRIPKIEVELPIYHGTSETVLQSAVGHFEGTSFPVGGESSHAVLTGHRGLPTKKLFTDIDKLETGDVFYVKILGETLAYEIDQIQTVLPENTRDLSIVSGKDYVTLVTCTPYAINTHRLLVRGVRVPYEEAVQTAADAAVETELSIYTKALLAGMGVLVLILIITCIYLWKHRKKQSSRRKKGR